MEKVEHYLITLGINYENIGEKSWLINDEEKGLGQIVILSTDSLLTLRVKVMEIPRNSKEEFYKSLLQLNGTDMVHGAYGIDQNDIVLIDTLEYQTMDIEEFQASLDAIGLALAQHYKILVKFKTETQDKI